MATSLASAFPSIALLVPLDKYLRELVEEALAWVNTRISYVSLQVANSWNKKIMKPERGDF